MLQLYWAGEGPYKYVGELEVAAAYRRTSHGAAFLRELQEPPELRKDGHGQLATHKWVPCCCVLLLRWCSTAQGLHCAVSCREWVLPCLWIGSHGWVGADCAHEHCTPPWHC